MPVRGVRGPARSLHSRALPQGIPLEKTEGSPLHGMPAPLTHFSPSISLYNFTRFIFCSRHKISFRKRVLILKKRERGEAIKRAKGGKGSRISARSRSYNSNLRSQGKASLSARCYACTRRGQRKPSQVPESPQETDDTRRRGDGGLFPEQ